MRIVCVGGGPAGLYFALLMKSRDPGHDILVLERCKADSQYGFGVTLGKDVLDYLRSNDAESAQEIERAGLRWDKQIVYFRGKEAAHGGSDVRNISRQRLVDILADRAQRLGVKIQYGHEVLSPEELPDADLIVAADGAGSRIRQAVGNFQTDIQEGNNKYIWLAATKVFHSFNYLFAPTQAGWVWAYTYGFGPELSTFIVECSGETWDGLGLATMAEAEYLSLLERLFESHLSGHRLVGKFPDGTSAQWQKYRTVTNKRWHEGNIVLLGDRPTRLTSVSAKEPSSHSMTRSPSPTASGRRAISSRHSRRMRISAEPTSRSRSARLAAVLSGSRTCRATRPSNLPSSQRFYICVTRRSCGCSRRD